MRYYVVYLMRRIGFVPAAQFGRMEFISHKAMRSVSDLTKELESVKGDLAYQCDNVYELLDLCRLLRLEISQLKEMGLRSSEKGTP